MPRLMLLDSITSPTVVGNGARALTAVCKPWDLTLLAEGFK